MTPKQSGRLKAALQERLIAILYCHIPATVLGALTVFGINLAYYGGELPAASLYWWVCLTLLFAITRTALYMAHRRRSGLFSPVTWRNLHAGTTLCHATAWIVNVAAVVSLGSPPELTIAVISVAGVVGAAIATTSASIVSFGCFTIPLALSLPLLMWPLESGFHYTLVAEWIAWFAFMLISGHRVHHTLITSEQNRLEKEALVDELKILSERDPLTNLYNRRRFASRLDDAWQEARAKGCAVGLLVADIDYFKRYNDAVGHGAGDECLRAVADELERFCEKRSAETLLARYGGEEFVVLLPNTDLREATKLGEALRCHLEQCEIPHPDSSISAYVTLSVGVATLPPEEEEREPLSLFREADLALYRAKSRGRNCVVAAELTAPLVSSPEERATG
ncbi:MAG: GGDEF domain-containing protein [Pseudomonadota bacterium]